MNEIMFISVPRGKREQVKATLFTCSSTKKRVLANNVMIPVSPFTGKVMARATDKKIEITASDMKEAKLRKVGVCATCNHDILANAQALTAMPKKLHCVTCGNVVQVRADINDLIPEALPENTDLNLGGNLHNTDETLADDILASMDDDDDENGDDDDNDQDSNDDENADGNEDDDDDDDYDPDEDDDDDAEDDDDDDNNDDEDGDDTNDDDSDYDDYDDGSDDDDENTGDDDSDSQGDGDTTQSDDDDEDSDNNMDATAGANDDAVDEDADEDDDTEVTADTDEDTDDTTNAEDKNDDTVEANVAREININASETLIAALNGENASMQVIPVNATSAMVLAMVDGVGYMPYLMLEAHSAADEFKGVFANSTKLVQTVNAVISSADNFSSRDLKPLGARELTYSINSSKLVEQRIAQGIQAATASLEDERKELADDMRQCLAIASVEVLKNLAKDKPNVVASTLAEELTKIGVRKADNLITSAFSEKGPELMQTIIARALELMLKPLAARNEVAMYVEAATGREIDFSATASVANEAARALSTFTAAPVKSTTTTITASDNNGASNVIDYSNLVKVTAGNIRAKVAR